MSDTQATEKIFAGARLRRLRRERGLTQAEAAEALGVSARASRTRAVTGR